jgi:hypothetical protein
MEIGLGKLGGQCMLPKIIGRILSMEGDYTPSIATADTSKKPASRPRVAATFQLSVKEVRP